MLLENSDAEKGAGSGPPGPQGNNGAALANTTSNYGQPGADGDTSDAQSIVSVVAEPVDRMTMIEQSNHRIEAMLGQLMNGGGGSPLSTIGSSAGLSHRKVSTEQTLHENELQGTDHLHYAPSRGSHYSNR